MTEEEYFRKNYPDNCYGDKPLSPYWDFFQDGVEFGERQSEKKIADLEWQLKQVIEDNDYYQEENKNLQEELEKWKAEWQEQVQKATDEGYARTQLQIENGKLKKQIEKMKCCANCKYTPPFDKHCDNCIQGAIKLKYKNWKLGR